VLAELVAKVYTIEIVAALGLRARQILGELGYRKSRCASATATALARRRAFDAIIAQRRPRRYRSR